MNNDEEKDLHDLIKRQEELDHKLRQLVWSLNNPHIRFPSLFKLSPEQMAMNMSTEERLEKMQHLIDEGADVWQSNSMAGTLLHETTNAQVAQLLLENGADVNATDDFDYTPEMKHRMWHNPEVVEVIQNWRVALDKQEIQEAIEEHLDTWTPSNVNGEAMQRDVAGIEPEEQVVFERRESRGRKM